MEQPVDGDVENHSGLKVSEGVGDLPSAEGHRAMTRSETGNRSRCVSMTILCLFLLAAGIMVLVLAVSGGDDSNPRTAPIRATSLPTLAPSPSNDSIETNSPTASPVVAATEAPTTLPPGTDSPTPSEENEITGAPTIANTTAPTLAPVATTAPTIMYMNSTLDGNETTASPTPDNLFVNATTFAPTLAPNAPADNNATDDSGNTTTLAPTLSPPGVKTIEPALNGTQDGEDVNNAILANTTAEPTVSPSSNATDLESG